MPSTKTSMLDAALEYAELGLPVIPLHGVLPDGTCTCGAERCPSPGKHPRTANGLKDATTDRKQIRKWWGRARWPNASIGGVGGDFLCLDIDAKHDGLETLERLIEANAPLPDTAVAETGAYEKQRGRHYWFRVPSGVKAGTRSAVREGIDIRCHGGYAVMPPSPHASGVDYEWITDIELSDAALCPEWVTELVPEHVEGDSSWTPNPDFRMAKQVKDFLTGKYTPEIGEQREFLTQAARSVLTTGRSVELTAELLWEGTEGDGGICACEWGEDPWMPEDIYGLVCDIFAKPPTSPLEKSFENTFTLDDFGNAARLVASFKEGHVLHVPELSRWYIWDDTREQFVGDDGGWMRSQWEQVTQLLSQQAAAARSEDEMKVLYQHAKKSRHTQRIDAAVKLARDLVRVPQHLLNPDPFMLSVENGVVDLRDGELYEPEPDNLLTRHCRAPYDPKARSTVFEEFLERVVPDEDLRGFLQLAAGYTLTGSIAEHKFFFLYGPPASGKSTFLEAFLGLMGSYAMVTDPSTFMRKPGGNEGGGPSEHLARLAGTRLVVTHEIEEGQRFAEALISRFTSGDKVAARFLHSPTFEYRPYFKLWIGANHRARVSGSPRSGLWRRLLVIPMEQQIPEGERNPRLQETLREPEARSAILTWAVEGARRWIERNEAGEEMEVPSIVKEEVKEYQHESDYLFSFIEEAVERTGDPDDRISKPDFFDYYLGWCEQEGRKSTMTAHALSRKLTDSGFEWKNAWCDGKTRACWIGLRFKGLNVGKKKPRRGDSTKEKRASTRRGGARRKRRSR